MRDYGVGKMYSSEWMVLDFTDLEKGSVIPRDTFIVFWSSMQEQIISDMTQHLIVMNSFV